MNAVEYSAWQSAGRELALMGWYGLASFAGWLVAFVLAEFLEQWVWERERKRR